MEIPFDFFDEITGAGNSAATNDSSDSNRRQHRRLPFGSRGTLSALRGIEEGPTNVVMLRDISMGGIGFLNAEPLKIGDTFVIRFTGQSGRQFKMHCSAQRCDSGGTGGTQYVIGATFEKLIEPTEALPPKADGTSAQAESPKPVTPRAPITPVRKSSLFQTPKLDTGSQGQEPAPMPVTNSAPPVATAAAPDPALASVGPIGAVAAAPPKLEEHSQPAADTFAITAAALAPNIEAAPIVEAAPIPAAAPIVAVAEPVLQKMEQRNEPTPQPTVVAIQAAEPIQLPAVLPIPEASVSLANHTSTATPVPAPQTASIALGKNQELVAEVKSRFLKQHQAMKSQVHQMEETNRQVAEQKAQIEDLGRQRDALHAMFVKAGQQLTEEQERSASEIEALRRAVLELRENQRALQAKSESDDRAIAELAALLDTEAGVMAAGN